MPASIFREVRRGISMSSLPFGPSTKTFEPLTSTFTLAGMAMGCFPIRDIKSAVELPDVAEDFPAHVFLARILAAHHALRGRDNRNAEAVAHARNLGRTHVIAQARCADPAQPVNDRFAAIV